MPEQDEWCESTRPELGDGEHLFAGKTNDPGHIALLWVLGTVIGTTISTAALGALVGTPVMEKMVLYLLALVLLLGIALGILQALVLRIPLAGKLNWVLASGLGWPLGMVLVGLGLIFATIFLGLFIEGLGVKLNPGPEVTQALLAGTVLSPIIIVALMQRSILRQYFRSVNYWIWSNTVGWSMAWAVAIGIAEVMPGSNNILQGAVAGAGGGAVVGMITGWALSRMEPVSLTQVEPGNVRH